MNALADRMVSLSASRAAKKLFDVDLKRSRYSSQDTDRRVSFAALNAAQIRLVDLRAIGKLLLRQLFAAP